MEPQTAIKTPPTTSPITLDDLWSALGDDQRRKAAEAFWNSHTDPKVEEERDRVQLKLARAMNFRPQFLQRAKPPEKVKWLLAKIGTTDLRDERELLLRVWLLTLHTTVIEKLLDSLKIPHKHGLIEGEVTPPTLDNTRNAVKQLLETCPPLPAAEYLGYLCLFPIDTLKHVPEAIAAAKIDLRAALGIEPKPAPRA